MNDIQMARTDEIIRLTRENKRLSCEVRVLIGLLNAAQCPNCDGSGAYMIKMSSTNAELQQCEWCAKKNAAVSGNQE